ncbi:MAG: AAA family ATPase [Acidimicrobiia bacterium]|nr:AAA family ATPase [Acidimicrobiia bacterium]
MPRIIAVANQKGGVAKTTTVHAIAAALVERGRSVLAIDLDPQASLSYALGLDDDADPSIHDVMMGRASIDEILYDSSGIDLAPSTIDLAGSEVHLLTRTGREFVLQRALRAIADRYDYVFIDCPPSLGILTINALTAAREVLVPLQAELLTRRGLGQLLETVEDVRAYTNPDLEVTGAVITMWDSRTRLGREVTGAIEEAQQIRLLEPFIPKSVKVAEAPGRGRSILDHARTSPPAVAYRELAASLDGPA